VSLITQFVRCKYDLILYSNISFSFQEKLQIKGQQRRTSNDGISLTHTVQSNKLSLVSKKYMEEFESNSISTIDNSDAIRVCLRIRPMNKLETSRRSRDCIKVHENCQKYTVDSPLDGKYEFTYDKVCSINQIYAAFFIFAIIQLKFCNS